MELLQQGTAIFVRFLLLLFSVTALNYLFVWFSAILATCMQDTYPYADRKLYHTFFLPFIVCVSSWFS